MAEGKQPFSDRLYGMLLRVLPFEFRLEFGSDMEETFHQQRVETARDHGLKIDIEARRHDIDGLVEAIRDFFSKKSANE